MKERIITLTLFLLLCVPFEMHGQGRNIVKGVLKGITVRSHAPIITKVGKPFTVETRLKDSSLGWEKISNNYNYQPSEITINRSLKNGTRLVLEQKATAGSFKDSVLLLIANPVQDIVWTGNEIELFSDCRLLQRLPPDIIGFKLEQILRIEGDSIPFARNFIDIEVESTQEDNYKAEKVKKTKEKRVYTVQSLFDMCEELGKDVEEETKRCRDDFLAFLEHENYLNKTLKSNRRSEIAMSFVSFYRRWRMMKYVPSVSGVNGSACYRFLTIDCNLKSSTDCKAFEKFIRRTVNAVTKKIENEENVDPIIENKVNDWFLTHEATH